MQQKDFVTADSSYVKVIEKSPNYANAYLNRGKANAAQDPENKTWAGKPFFELYLSKVDMADAKAKNGIMLAYEYLGAEAWKGVKNNEKATEYYTKLKELDPENAAAKAFFTKAPGK
jgi:tetratricopeptide (TPR) repeat protein